MVLHVYNLGCKYVHLPFFALQNMSQNLKLVAFLTQGFVCNNLLLCSMAVISQQWHQMFENFSFKWSCETNMTFNTFNKLHENKVKLNCIIQFVVKLWGIGTRFLTNQLDLFLGLFPKVVYSFTQDWNLIERKVFYVDNIKWYKLKKYNTIAAWV